LFSASIADGANGGGDLHTRDSDIEEEPSGADALEPDAVESPEQVELAAAIEGTRERIASIRWLQLRHALSVISLSVVLLAIVASGILIVLGAAGYFIRVPPDARKFVVVVLLASAFAAYLVLRQMRRALSESVGLGCLIRQGTAAVKAASIVHQSSLAGGRR